MKKFEEEPLVSYVICTYDSDEFIEDNLESIKNQEYENQEIIVVDNCSDDRTREIIERKFPDVKLIVLPNSSYGACEAFNIGFTTSKGKYIGILDDDVELEKDWTRKLVDVLEAESKNLALVQPRIIEPDKKKEVEGEITDFQGCGVLARKNALEEVGYYDERFFIYSNERDLAYRLINEGYKLEGFPVSTTYHKTERDLSPFFVFYNNRNKMWIYWKYCDTYNAVMNSLYHLIAGSKNSLRQGYFRTFLAAILSSFKGFRTYFIQERNPNPKLDYRKWSVRKILETIRN